MLRLEDTIRRRFADIDIGQIHYYTSGEQRSHKAPLCLMGPSPWSSRWLSPLLSALGQSRWVFAPDTLGQGDSSPPPEGIEVDMAYLGDTMAKLLDGMGIEQCDLLGMHTGGHVAMELAIRHPDRVRRLILEGLGVPPQQIKDEYSANILKTPKPDPYGSHFTWAFNMNRDMFLFFPYYKKDEAHRRTRELPGADELHERALDILKNIESYHHAYIAAWQNNAGGEKFKQIPVPTLLTLASPDTAEDDINEVAALIPDCRVALAPPGSKSGDLVPLTQLVVEFLDGD